jgi:hypothetical protein
MRFALILGTVLCLQTWCGPAEAAEPALSASSLCRVQHAIRWRSPAWTRKECDAVAGAVNVTATPVTLAAICTNESDLRERAIAWHGPDVADVGLCGVRCQLRDDRRCTNGAAAGLTVRDLQDPVTNIAVAAAILASKGSVGRYNSGTPSIGRAYEARIAVLAAALSGVPVEPKRIKGKRLRKLVEQIAAALRPEGNS